MTDSPASKDSHHAPGGGFRNPWPDSEPRGWRDVLRWTRERRHQERTPTPAFGSFPTATPDVVHPRAAKEIFTATWIGHSTVLMQMGGLNVITDPVFSDRAFPVQWLGPRRVMPPAMAIGALPPLDVVLLSHSHYDHLDKPAVKRLAGAHSQAHWVVPLGLGEYLRGWGVRHITELDWWQAADVKGLHVVGTPARHFSARRAGDRNKILWCGFAFELDGKRAYFVADTAYHPEFGAIASACGPFDFVMMPVGAYDPRWFMHVVHVDPEEAVQAISDMVSQHPTAPVPLTLAIHWGTFRLTDEPMDEPPRRAMENWNAHRFDPSLLWVARFGETRSW